MDPSSIGHGAGGGETLQDPARERIQPMLTSRSRKVTTMSVPGSSQIQFPGTLSADFEVDQVTDPGGAPANVLDLDLGFAVNGHIDFPNWLAGTETSPSTPTSAAVGMTKKFSRPISPSPRTRPIHRASRITPGRSPIPSTCPPARHRFQILRLRRVRWCTASPPSSPSTVCSRTSQRSWTWVPT